MTTTSYALLAVLRLRPFSAYELTKYMRRSALSELWPRTEAALYREPKLLVARGLVTARAATKAGRDRTEYRITGEGRRALDRWLREPGADLSFECEAAVKAFFADAVDLATLRAHLEHLAHAARAGEAERAIDQFAARQVQLPERIQYTAMAADLIATMRFAVAEWAQRWLDHTEHWTSTELDATSQADADRTFRSIQRRLRAVPRAPSTARLRRR